MRIFLLVILISLSSCAKLSYMSEQAFGQISLEWNGEDNETVLKDPKVSEKFKNKIKLVQKAKAFFYNYFKMDPTPIYGETTILDQDAVTYLVIHSKKSHIEAQKVNIPFVGEFPYLGFFKEESAKEFAKDKIDEGYATYIRPVYAYSTLNHPMIPFHDNILSSFFRYSDEDLISTIFHELVHTVVFIDNQVQFNENLAQFISDELMKIYYRENPNYGVQRKRRIENQVKISKKVIELSSELNHEYKMARSEGEKNPSYEKILNQFLENRFKPEIETLCQKLQWTNKCWPLKGTWNNARFAALKTYESKRDNIELIFKESNLSLREFLNKVIKTERKYDGKKPFLESLVSKEK